MYDRVRETIVFLVNENAVEFFDKLVENGYKEERAAEITLPAYFCEGSVDVKAGNKCYVYRRDYGYWREFEKGVFTGRELDAHEMRRLISANNYKID